MNRGILLKAVRELWPATVLLSFALLIAQAILAYVLPTFQREITSQMFRIPLIQNLIRGLLGVDARGALGPEMFESIGWVHPVVLAITWAHAIIICTRVPAGEIDRGTIDVLLGLPVSRWNLFISETGAWLVSGIILLAAGLTGNAIGHSFLPPQLYQPPMARLLIVLVNFFALYCTVGAMAWLFSAMSDRRGRAMGAAFGVVLASFLLNYLAQFWEPAESVSFLGLLQYYRPLFILRDGAWPVRDLAVLGALIAGFWIAAGLIFSRRDLSTT